MHAPWLPRRVQASCPRCHDKQCGPGCRPATVAHQPDCPAAVAAVAAAAATAAAAPSASQRTNKSFNARRWAQNRTYEYYLPAAVLGLETTDGSSASDQAKLALLRDVLQTYCGYIPYHNYAGQRSQYVQQKAKGECGILAQEATCACAHLASPDALSAC